MTIKEILGHAQEILSANNIEEPILESELLLMEALEIDQIQLYLEFDRILNPPEEETFWHLIKRRLNLEPTAYIIGHREFYGLDFYVDPRVFIPRPESELLVEKALDLAKKHPISTIADVGTGCGAIAISLALNLPRTKIYAIDLSAFALKVAQLNCQKHRVENRISLLPGDMLEPLPEAVDLIVANLPYVRKSELAKVNTLPFEPPLALDGGANGLEKISRLCSQIGERLRSGGHSLLEIGQGQSRAVTTLLSSHFPSAKIEVIPDLNGIERVVSLALPR